MPNDTTELQQRIANYIAKMILKNNNKETIDILINKLKEKL
ncbi:hypothetical protein [uncultured Clostridium sp.]|nr:hypothetical protein [uncultured Clostridium sp.]